LAENIVVSHDAVGSAEELRTKLLSGTLKHAWQSSRFYRRLWGKEPRANTLADLAGLPLTNKKALEENLDDIATDAKMPDFVQFTGGTSGVAALRYRSLAETEWLGRRSRVLQSICGGPRKLCLHILVPFNGPELVVPDWPSFIVPLVLEKHFLQVDRLLRRRYQYDGWEPRISTILSGLDRLKMLTAYVLEQNIDVSAYSVCKILSSAAFLTGRWRRIVERTWNARVIDVFGLSEVSDGVAVECLYCGGYHVDPIAIPEILSIEDPRPVRTGLGVLVLTSLYPFVQFQPVIRYWTDDIVEIMPRCEVMGEAGFRFRGRRSQTVIQRVDGILECLLFPTDVVDVLDELPEVALEPETTVVGLKTRDIGYHKWSTETHVSDRVCSVIINVELKISPCLYAQQLDVLRERITLGLMARNRRLATLIQNGRVRLQIQFHPPGSLQKIIV
jgi:hypothetical protein